MAATTSRENLDTAADFRVSAEQIEFFRTFGFLKFPGLFKADVDRFREGFDEAPVIIADHEPSISRRAAQQIFFPIIIGAVDRHDLGFPCKPTKQVVGNSARQCAVVGADVARARDALLQSKHQPGVNR